MALLDQEYPPERRKRTQWLLLGGAASLLIPLAGAVYLHISENAGAPGPSGRSDLFERRDGNDLRIVPTQTAVVPPSALTAPPPSGLVYGVAKGQGSSLDFIKGSEDLKARMADSKVPGAGPPSAPTPAAAAAPPPAAAAPSPAASTAAQKSAGKVIKPFNMPKLKTSNNSWTSGFGSNSVKGSAAPGAAVPGNVQLPAGVQNNPAVQQYLQNHPNGQ